MVANLRATRTSSHGSHVIAAEPITETWLNTQIPPPFPAPPGGGGGGEGDRK
jgi:hypothetical protein